MGQSWKNSACFVLPRRIGSADSPDRLRSSAATEIGMNCGAAGAGISQRTPKEVRSSASTAPTLADAGISKTCWSVVGAVLQRRLGAFAGRLWQHAPKVRRAFRVARAKREFPSRSHGHERREVRQFLNCYI